VGRPRCSRIRVVPTLDVTTATIAIRPGHRAHARTSSRNTRHISDAHGNRPGCLGASAPSGTAARPDGGSSVALGTISGLPANRGGQHAAVSDQVGPWARGTIEISRSMSSWGVYRNAIVPIAPRPFQAELQTTVIQSREPIRRNRGPGKVSPHPAPARSGRWRRPGLRPSSCNLRPARTVAPSRRRRGLLRGPGREPRGSPRRGPVAMMPRDEASVSAASRGASSINLCWAVVRIVGSELAFHPAEDLRRDLWPRPRPSGQARG
jgi:hypothetical protein